MTTAGEAIRERYIPFYYLRALIKAQPDTPEQTYDAFLAHAIEPGNESFRDEVIRRWWVANLTRACWGILPEPRVAKVADPDRAKRAEEAMSSRVLFLDQIMANDKPLRDCTGPECRKFGSFYAQIAKRVGQRKVGDVLTEDDIQDIRRSAKLVP